MVASGSSIASRDSWRSVSIGGGAPPAQPAAPTAPPPPPQVSSSDAGLEAKLVALELELDEAVAQLKSDFEARKAKLIAEHHA